MNKEKFLAELNLAINNAAKAWDDCYDGQVDECLQLVETHKKNVIAEFDRLTAEVERLKGTKDER